MTARGLAATHTDRSVLSSTRLFPRIGILAYGIGSYAVGFATLLLLILVSLGVVPFTGGPVRVANPVGAVLSNLGLLALFGLQHSVMARAGFKERWTRIIHPSMERSTFLLATGLVLLPLILLWQPLPAAVWSVRSPVARGVLTGLALLGWAYLFLATFAIDHFELFGLQQSWRGFRDRPPVPVPFRERWMYRFDRHPIMTGVLVGLWATPDLTVGRLLFNAGLSAYVLVGVYFEERALRRQLGEVYERYRERVPALVPTAYAPSRNAPYIASDLIAAPPKRIWPMLADVQHWPDWLPTMISVEPLGPAELAPGASYRITQPKFRPAVWTVVGLEPLRAFSWVTRSSGVRVLADHRLTRPMGSPA